MRQIAFVRHVWPQKLTDFLAVGVTIHVLPMKSCSKFAKDAQKTHIFSSEKYRLEKSGNIIEDFDLMIGTTGVIGDLTVVTHNTKHFNRIEGIKLEDWTL